MRDRKRRRGQTQGARGNDEYAAGGEARDTAESERIDPESGEAGAEAGTSTEDIAAAAADTAHLEEAEAPQDELVEEPDRAPADAISEQLREELRELEELRDRHLRLAAEFDNYKRRTRKELLEAREAAQAALTAQLLDALDDLTRVADTPADSTTTEALHEGVALVERKLLKALSDAGMDMIDPLGERFDPNVHEALFAAETDDPEQDDLVSQVVVIGYKFGDRLLRPARVGVFQYDPDVQPA
jgi:molecular chaperone GrpE